MSHTGHQLIQKSGPPLNPARVLKVGGAAEPELSPRTKRSTGSPDYHPTPHQPHAPGGSGRTGTGEDRSQDGVYVVWKFNKDKFWVYAHRGAVEKFRKEWANAELVGDKGEELEGKKFNKNLKKKGAGDLRIALLDVLEQVQIFRGTSTAAPDRPSKALLASTFGEENEEEIARRILLEGRFE